MQGFDYESSNDNIEYTHSAMVAESKKWTQKRDVWHVHQSGEPVFNTEAYARTGGQCYNIAEYESIDEG